MARLKISGSKPYVELEDTDTSNRFTIANSGTNIQVNGDIEISKPLPSVRLTDYDSGTSASISYDGSRVSIDKEVDATKLVDTTVGASLDSHGSRHSRGGPDPLDWSSVSRYKVVTGVSIAAGPSGSPKTGTVVTLDQNFYNMLPLTIKVTPSGLGTNETLTISVVAKDENGNSYTLATKSGVSAAVALTLSDLDFTAFGGTRITEIDLSVESSATSTTATVSVDAAVIET